MTTSAKVRILTRLVDEPEFELRALFPDGFTQREFMRLWDVAWALEEQGLCSVWQLAVDDALAVVICRPGCEPAAEYGGAA